MADRRQFMRACLAAGGLILVPKLADRFRWKRPWEPAPSGLWVSSNPLIASVDDRGLVTYHRKGSVTISYLSGEILSDDHLFHLMVPG